jgi:hypothetical protein
MNPLFNSCLGTAVCSTFNNVTLDVVSWVAVCCCSAAYQAWPVVHTTLSDAGLKGVDVEEVSSSLQDSRSYCVTTISNQSSSSSSSSSSMCWAEGRRRDTQL